MRQNGFFASIIYLFVIFLLFAIGFLLIGLKEFETLSSRFVEILLYKKEILLVIGLFFLGVALILLFSFYFLFRHKYISLVAKPFNCQVDIQIVEQYAKKCLKELLKEEIFEIEVHSLKNFLEIILYIPTYKKIDKKVFLEKALKELTNTLWENLSYKNKFILTLKQV